MQYENTVGTRYNVLEGTRVFWTLNPSVVKSNSKIFTIFFFLLTIFKKRIIDILSLRTKNQ